jgi:hypothetical protein
MTPTLWLALKILGGLAGGVRGAGGDRVRALGVRAGRCGLAGDSQCENTSSYSGSRFAMS